MAWTLNRPTEPTELCQWMVHCTCGRFKGKVRAPWDSFTKEDLRGRKWGVPDVVYQRWETVAVFVGSRAGGER
eukprot:13769282-Alexandrium_andersonii.AAC.1